MNDALVAAARLPAWEILVLAAVAGAVLGTAFFTGLWWTTWRAARSDQPAWWLLGSLLVRMGLTLWGFYLVADGHWARMMMGLLGFLVARAVVVRLTVGTKEADCAS